MDMTDFAEIYQPPQSRPGIGENIQFSKQTEFGETWIKVAFAPRKATCNNLRVEMQIYEHVLLDLLKYTPHIPEWYKTVEFTPNHRKIPKQHWMEDYDLSRATAMYMEKITGELMGKKVNDPLIMFQLLYTIECFERIGLKHNDLHVNNILISTLKEPMVFSYDLGENIIVSFKTDKFVQIVDYDRASIYNPNVERNFFLDEPDRLGHNGFVPSFDTCHLFLYILEGKMAKWVSMMAPKLRLRFGGKNRITWDSNPRTFVPDNLTLLKDIIQRWPKLFKEEMGIEYKFPPVSRLKVIPKMRVQRSRYVDFFKIRDRLTALSEEFFVFNYDWFGLAEELYLKNKDKARGKFRSLFSACLWVTCPVVVSKPTKFVDMLPVDNYPKMPQKPTPEIWDCTFLKFVYQNRTPVYAPFLIRECRPEEIESSRILLVEEWKKYILDTNCPLEKPYTNTIQQFRDLTKEFLSTIEGINDKSLKAVLCYILYSFYSKTISIIKDCPKFLEVVHERATEFSKEGFDLIEVLESKEIIPIGKVLGQFWKKQGFPE